MSGHQQNFYHPYVPQIGPLKLLERFVRATQSAIFRTYFASLMGSTQATALSSSEKHGHCLYTSV
jgi:hypothetical protein